MMKKYLKAIQALLIALAVVVSLSGCSTVGRILIAMEDDDLATGRSSIKRSNEATTSNTGVKPWQKGKLSRKEMAWDPDTLGGSASDYFKGSREGLKGSSCAGSGSFGCR